MTTLTLTPDFDEKTLTVTGKVSVGEKVDVIVTGVTEAQTANLRVRFRQDGVTVARYPLADGDVWTYAASTATANMTLNTDLFRALFEGLGDRDKIQCVIITDNTDDLNQYAAALITVGNWPVEAGADVPYNLTEYPDDVAALQAEMDQAQADIDAAEALIGSHTHNGSGSQVLSHDDLLLKGTKTHDQIDAELTAIAASQVTVSGVADACRVDFNDIKTLCDTVKAMPTAYAAQREARFAALVQGLIDILT
jgi:antitoxin component HigA of HigAB toxin-antitoxin module